MDMVHSVAEWARQRWLLLDTSSRRLSWTTRMSAAMSLWWPLHVCCLLWTWIVMAIG